MTKNEVALQLTLKAMSLCNGMVGIYSTDSAENAMKNAEALANFYNTLVGKLNIPDNDN